MNAHAFDCSVLETEGYKLAFWGVQSAPVGVFDRGQRKRIFKAVLQFLLSKALPIVAMTVDHLNVLIENIDVSNNSWSLLSIEDKSSAEGLTEGCSTNEAPLLCLARQIDNNQSSNFSNSLTIAFTCLVRLTLR